MALQPPSAAPAIRPIAHSLSRRRRWTNSAALVVCGLALATIVALFAWILTYIVIQGLPAISLDFFTNLPTPVGVPGGGIANALVGSAMTVGLALLIAAPIGIFAALYTAARPAARSAVVIRFVTDTLAGVPSIVMGIVAYAIVVRPQGHFSAFAGGVVLAFIMVPIILRTTDEMLRLVPGSLREASLALGAPVWSTSSRIVIPAALNGILTGLLLATARAAGEAAPMLFTAFGNPFMSTDFSQPVATLPHTVFVYAISPYEDWRQKAWATALVLIVLVLVLNISARAIVSLRSRQLELPDDRDGGEFGGGRPTGTDRTCVPATSIAAADGAVASARTTRIAIRTLNVYYGEFRAIRDVTLDVPTNSVTAIIGPSGCGKSTLLRSINRMTNLVPGARTVGEIELDGTNVLDPGVDAVDVRRRIGMVFQRPNPFPKSIFDNVAYGPRLYGTRGRTLDEIVESTLRDAALWDEVKDKLRKSALGLSGGQQQRLCIARTMAVNPEVILMDEPASALDPVATLRIEELISRLRERYTIVIVTHNMQQAARVSDVTAFFTMGDDRAGYLVEMDATARIFTNPKERITEDYVSGRFG